MFEILVDAFVGYLAADLIMGAYHWIKDTYFYPLDPIIGETFIWGSRLHHIDQDHFAKKSDIDIVADSTKWTLPLAIPTFYLFGINSFTVTMFGFICINDLIHKYMHLDNIPDWAKKMQEIGIFQKRVDHDKHHQYPHIVYYCPISPYVNPVLESFNFWRNVENIVFSITGAKPRYRKNEYVIDNNYPAGIKFV